MALIGLLWVNNETTKILKIYQGPKHKNYRGAVGPKSWAGFPVNDTKGKTYFRATPESGKSYDLAIPPYAPGQPVQNYTWTII